MSAQREKGRAEVGDLARRFGQHGPHRGDGYSEASARKDYISPFFDALGWPTSGRGDGLVEVEWSTDQKRADYAFLYRYEKGKVAFVVEAKAPSCNIIDNEKAFQQAAKYGNTAPTQLVVLTNFRDLIVFVPSSQKSRRSKNKDAPAWRVHFSFHYNQYEANWNTIYDLLGMEMVQRNSIGASIRNETMMGADLASLHGGVVGGVTQPVQPHSPLNDPNSVYLPAMQAAIHRVAERYEHPTPSPPMAPYQPPPMGYAPPPGLHPRRSSSGAKTVAVAAMVMGGVLLLVALFLATSR
ncbi:MAG: type I restriction enzyme HsdR N-terminal domain-containing protein [Myxococcales bacterium]|nr:type I restriction enzyme HsdR N-terminal domain-containing protein [Myxococcales bacterium]